MSKTLEATEHDSPRFFDCGALTHIKGDVRVFSKEIPDSENAPLAGPEQDLGCGPGDGEWWDCTGTNILDIARS